MPSARGAGAVRFRLPWLHGDCLGVQNEPTSSSRHASVGPSSYKRAPGRAAGTSVQRSSSTGVASKLPKETTRIFLDVFKADPPQQPLVRDIHSPVTKCYLDRDGAAPFAVIAPKYAPARSHRQLPTVLAISGTSNGGASVAAVATRVPHLVASLTLVTGFVPDCLTDFRSLLTILTIRLYVGDKDEMGHCQALQGMHEQIDNAGGSAQLDILEGARHGNIGHYIDMGAFWDGLEAARWLEILR